MIQKNPVGGVRWRYDGIVAYNGANLSLPLTVPAGVTLKGLAAPYGAIGWNRTRPTRELASALVAFGELRNDGLPRAPVSILGDALKRLGGWRSLKNAGVAFGTAFRDPSVRRALGSEYLNFDFGWRPLVEDAQKLLNFQDAVSRRLAQWEQAGNGRTSRRRMNLKDETTTSETYPDGINPIMGGYLDGVGSLGTWRGTRTRVVTTRDSIWYSAGYRLNIPDLTQSPFQRAYVKAALLGGIPTAETVWNLTPWSWLADWFGNYGDAIANVSDPLQSYFAATYAYVMFKRETTTTITVVAEETSGIYEGTDHVSVGGEFGTVTKFRTAASPFGFGSTWDSLSASQLATAAALGISRV